MEWPPGRSPVVIHGRHFIENSELCRLIGSYDYYDLKTDSLVIECLHELTENTRPKGRA